MEFEADEFQSVEYLIAFCAGKAQKILLPTPFPSPSVGGGRTAETRMDDFAMKAPCQRKLSDFRKEPSPEGRGGKMLDETHN